jgi:hypothetical protein
MRDEGKIVAASLTPDTLIQHSKHTCPKQPWPETWVEGRVPNAARNARPGAVGPDARKASPQRRGVLDVRRRRRRAKPDKADGPTPPALPRRGGGAFKAAQEGAAREAGQKRKGHGEKSPARNVSSLSGLLEPWPMRLLAAATTWRRAFVVVSGGLASKPSDSCPQSPVIATVSIAGKIVLDSSAFKIILCPWPSLRAFVPWWWDKLLIDCVFL